MAFGDARVCLPPAPRALPAHRHLRLHPQHHPLGRHPQVSIFPQIPLVFWGQFHQRFMSSFFALRSQKRKKTLMTRLSLALLGSLHVKAACKMLLKLTPGGTLFQPMLPRMGLSGKTL